MWTPKSTLCSSGCAKREAHSPTGGTALGRRPPTPPYFNPPHFTTPSTGAGRQITCLARHPSLKTAAQTPITTASPPNPAATEPGSGGAPPSWRPPPASWRRPGLTCAAAGGSGQQAAPQRQQQSPGPAARCLHPSPLPEGSWDRACGHNGAERGGEEAGGRGWLSAGVWGLVVKLRFLSGYCSCCVSLIRVLTLIFHCSLPVWCGGCYPSPAPQGR